MIMIGHIIIMMIIITIMIEYRVRIIINYFVSNIYNHKNDR